jgi:hypothetical protein
MSDKAHSGMAVTRIHRDDWRYLNELKVIRQERTGIVPSQSMLLREAVALLRAQEEAR